MSLEKRRALLETEINALLDMVASPAYASQRDADGEPLEGSSLAELEHRLKKKITELHAIDNRANSFYYQFWDLSHSLLFLLWSMVVCALIFSLAAVPHFSPGYAAFFVLATLACTAWAIWASIPPKV